MTQNTITAKQFQEYLQTGVIPVNDKSTARDDVDPGPESALQGKIMKWAKDHGYPCQCFRRSRKAKGFLVPGWPD